MRTVAKSNVPRIALQNATAPSPILHRRRRQAYASWWGFKPVERVEAAFNTPRVREVRVSGRFIGFYSREDDPWEQENPISGLYLQLSTWAVDFVAAKRRNKGDGEWTGIGKGLKGPPLPGERFPGTPLCSDRWRLSKLRNPLGFIFTSLPFFDSLQPRRHPPLSFFVQLPGFLSIFFFFCLHQPIAASFNETRLHRRRWKMIIPRW